MKRNRNCFYGKSRQTINRKRVQIKTRGYIPGFLNGFDVIEDNFEKASVNKPKPRTEDTLADTIATPPVPIPEATFKNSFVGTTGIKSAGQSFFPEPKSCTSDEDSEDPITEETRFFPGSPVSTSEAFTSILAYALRHKLSGSALSSLLELIDSICPKTPTSTYVFNKYFVKINSDIECTKHCNNCYRPVKGNACEECNSTDGFGYLLTFSIGAQLQAMFSRPDFFKNVHHRFSRKKENVDGLEDIYDGELYRNQCENGFMNNPSNLSFMWYSDGAALYKSSKISIWPFCFVINELPYSMRYFKENVIVASLWCSSVKPLANMMLESVLPECRLLFQGIDIDVANFGVTSVRAVILNGTADTPARALFLNMVQHTGYYSCAKCLAEGSRVGGKQVFPYAEIPAPLRSVEVMVHDADLAALIPPISQTQHVRGVKGHTQLKNLVPE